MNGMICFIVFLKYRDKLSTNQKSSNKLEVPFGTKFLIFPIFPAIRKNNFLPKINKNIFPAKFTPEY